MNVTLRALALAAVLAVPAPLQAATLNIVAIGASNTTGFGVGAQDAYPAQLQALLRKKGVNANVTNAGVNGDVTAGMRGRLDAAVPKGTDIVILQPGANDLRFFGTKQARAANVAAMVAHLHARGIRVIVYDPANIPPDFYQWDHIHFNAAAHAKIAATLAAQIAAPPTQSKPERIARQSLHPSLMRYWPLICKERRKHMTAHAVPRHKTPVRRRGRARAVLTLPFTSIVLVVAAAAAFISYVLWPTWPSQPTPLDAPAIPITVAGVLFDVPPAAIRDAVQRHPGRQERIDLAFRMALACAAAYAGQAGRQNGAQRRDRRRGSRRNRE